MKIKVNEATPRQLDWMVAEAEGLRPFVRPKGIEVLFAGLPRRVPFSPSTDWAQGGPIIDREKLCVGYRHQPDLNYCEELDPKTVCWARTTTGGHIKYGPTPLIAAMRCYVASKLSDEVEIPEELI